MQLTPGVTINSGDSVNRQTIYDLVANALGGEVSASDLGADVQPLTSQTDVPTPYPGKLWFDLVDQLLKVYVDELDGTGVSVWLAIGPDRFDTAVLATEPIPFGAAVQIAGTGGRRVKLPPSPTDLRAIPGLDGVWEDWKVIGFNQGGRDAASTRDTTESGAWLAAGIDGVMRAWYPARITTSISLGSEGNGLMDALISQTSGVTDYTGNGVRGGILAGGLAAQQANAKVGLAIGTTRFVPTAANQWNKVIFYGARIGRN
jgi:hypothetical protein